MRGELLQVGNVRATIVGVAPEGFGGVNDANPPVVYVPITTYAGSTGTGDARTCFTRYQWGWMHVMVRDKPGVTRARAEADATQAFRRSWQAARADDPDSPTVASASSRVVLSSMRPGANVANLVLARALRCLSCRARSLSSSSSAPCSSCKVSTRCGRSRWAMRPMASFSSTVSFAVGVTMILVALGASAVPAWRAAGVDPNGALRSE